MAKFGTFVSGTALFGAAAGTQPVYTGRLIWMAVFEWAGVWTNEGPYLKAPTTITTSGKERYVNTSGSGLELSQGGRASMTFDNTDGHFNPYTNTDIVLGVRCQINVKDRTSGITYLVFCGNVANVIPSTLGREVVIEVNDDFKRLEGQDAKTDVLFNTTADIAMAEVASSVGLNGNFQSSNAPITVFGVDKDNAASVLHRLAEASLGQLFISRGGVLTYYPLNYNPPTTHTIDQVDVDKEIVTNAPYTEKRTDIDISVNRWYKTREKALWFSSGAIWVLPGQTESFDVQFNEVSLAIQLNYEKGDYDRNTYVIVGESPGVALYAYISNIRAKGCTVNIVNSSPWEQATDIVIRGYEYVTSYNIPASRQVAPWSNAPQPSTSGTSTRRVLQTISSVSWARRSKMTLDNIYLQDANFAALALTVLTSHLANGIRNPKVYLYNDPAKQYGIEIQDKIDFTSATLGIDATYRAGKIMHEFMSANGQNVRTTLWMVGCPYDATAVTPEPTIPVPDEPLPPDPGGGGGVLPPSDPGTGGGGDEGCPDTAPANGPFGVALDGIVYNLATRIIYGPANYYLRGVNHANRTIYSFDGIVEETTDGITWATSYQPCVLTVRALKSGAIVASSTPIRTGNLWTGIFDVTGSPAIDTLGIEIAVSTGTLSKVATLATGTFDYEADVPTGARAGAGMPLSGGTLVDGRYYAVETIGASWANALGTSWDYMLSPDNITWEWSLTKNWLGLSNTDPGGLVKAGSPSFGIYAVATDAFHAIAYWRATTQEVYFRPHEDRYANVNTGGLQWKLSSVSVTNSLRVRIGNFVISNVCR